MRQNPDWRPIESAPRDGSWIAVRESQNTLMGGDHMATWVYGIWRDEENPTCKWWNGRHVVRPIEWSPAWAPCRERPRNCVNQESDLMFLDEKPLKNELFTKDQPKTDPINPDLLYANRLRIRAKVMQALMDGFIRAARDNGLTLANLAKHLDCHENYLPVELNKACEELDSYADIVFALGMDLEIALWPENDQ